jgi:hypothetical protein
MTQPSGPGSDLDTIKQILFGADARRLEQAVADARHEAGARDAELEQRLGRAFAELERTVGARLDEFSQKVTAQLEELSRRQEAHAQRVTQLLDQVMAEVARRGEAQASETRAALDEVRARLGDLERRKLNVTDFGNSLAALGQRFVSGNAGEGG